MARPMILLRCVLEGQEIPSIEGYQRALVSVPKEATILHLGSEPPANHICLFVLTPMRDPDPTDGLPKPYEPNEVNLLEFIIVGAGTPIAIENYVYRCPVRTDQGLIFLFQKNPGKGSGLIVVPGARI